MASKKVKSTAKARQHEPPRLKNVDGIGKTAHAESMKKSSYHGMLSTSQKTSGKHVSNDYTIVSQHLKNVRETLPRLILAERTIALTKENWVTNMKGDVKQSANDEQSLSLLKKELAMARTTVRASFGNRPVRFHAPMDFTITTTVTSGITKTVLMGGSTALQASNLTEWASLAALFDEVKVHGGLVDFLYNNFVTGNVTMTTDSRPIIGFDSADATAASGCSAVAQLAQHKTLDVYAGSGSASTNHHKFRFEIPKGVFADPAASFCGDVWQDVAGTTAVGAIKFYHIGGIVTAIVTGAGQLWLDVSFRCRA